MLLLCVLTASPLSAAEDVPAALNKLLARLPVDTAAKKDEIVGELIKLGAPGVRELCGRLKDEPLDGKVCSALYGLVHAVCRPGNEDVRKMVVGVFGDVLGSDASIAAKAHLIEELRTVGRQESVGPVGALLTEPKLCEPAAQTLVSISGAEAAAALRKALPMVQGSERVTVIYALGRLRDRAAVTVLLKEAGSADSAVRQAAVFALAGTGDPSAGAVLRKAAAAKDADERDHARHCLLRFARRLAETGNKKEAITVCRDVLKQAGPEEAGIASGAFYELTGFLPKQEALAEVVAGLGNESVAVRTAAIRRASAMPGKDVTAQLAEALFKLAPSHRGPLVEHLRQRGDAAALPAAVTALNDKEEEVRIAAIAAIGVLGKKDVAPKLIAFLDKTPEESAAARAALSAMGGKDLNKALVAALPEVTPEARSGLLTVLAARDAKGHRDVFLSCTEDEHKGVRHTALKILGPLGDEKVVTKLMKLLAKTESEDDRKAIERSLLHACRELPKKSHKKTAGALIREYAGGDVPVRCALVKVVTCTAEGYPEGLAHVRAAWDDDAPAVKGAALRALAEWPSPQPMGDLLKIAGDTKTVTENVLALRGYVRMAGHYASSKKKGDKEKALDAYKSAMAAARRPQEKKMVLSAVSAMAHPGALEIAVSCLSDTALSAEAAAGAVKIGRAMSPAATVFVAFDSRASDLPDWLEGWRDTKTKVKTSDRSCRFKLYSKTFPHGTITLGGNKAPGAGAHYIVILSSRKGHGPAVAAAMKKVLGVVKNEDLRKQAEKLTGRADAKGGFDLVKVSTGAGCKVVDSGLEKGAPVYVDRKYTFEEFPAELKGTSYVMTANNDKKCRDKKHLILRAK